MRTFVVLAVVAAGLTGCSVPSTPPAESGAGYPTETVQVIVPYAAGGPSDLAGRVIAECLSKELGENFVVENKDGGGGAIGTLEMVRSPADGYTLGLGTVSTLVVAPELSPDAGYTTEDVTPISKIYELDSALLVRGDSPFSTAQQLLESVKSNPGTVSVGVPGASSEFAFELRRMAQEYGIELTVVPFNGGAPAQNALIGGNVDALMAGVDAPVLDLLKGGELRALATGGEQRSEFVPDAPTLAELGFPALTNTQVFFSLIAPVGVDGEIRKALTESAHRCLNDDAVRKRLGENFVPTSPGDAESIGREYEGAAANLRAVLSK